MANRGKSYRGFKQVSGAKIGARSFKVRVCNSCGIQHAPGLKPERCMDKFCGGLAFTTFDSIGEAGRWATLCMKEKLGLVSNLQRQIRFTLWAARDVEGRTVQSKVAVYVADFTYIENEQEVIEDYKSNVIDPVAVLKLKFMEAMGKPVKITGS